MDHPERTPSTHDLPPMIPLQFHERTPEESLLRATAVADELERRRTVRDFSSRPVDPELIRQILRAANSAPSGANMQPWTFVVVTDPGIKRKIRIAAEEEERKNYEGRMSEEWRNVLRQFRTDWQKEYIETVPVLIVLFAQSYGVNDKGERTKHYYVQESVGIACGMLLAAAHMAGLATLTHTPSPMGFLADILERPENERAWLLIPVGYPAEGAEVPDLPKRELGDVAVWI